jgi:hypothetical protein
MMYLGAPVLAQETELHELTFVEFGALKAGDDGFQ